MPVAYLRQWADGPLIGCVFSNGGRKTIGLRSAAVRSDFYNARHADGTISTGLERRMGRLESRVSPILTALDARWPLSTADRVAIQEFVALQLVRSPGMREVWRQWSERHFADLGRFHDAAQRNRVRARWQQNAERNRLMVVLLERACTLVAGMHWTLLRFGNDRLVTSDHPVVIVPVGSPSTSSAVTDRGLLNTIEIRIALTPRHALLATWVPGPDPVVPVLGRPHHAHAFNAAVVAQAEQQWFHRPGTGPHPPAGAYRPVSFDVYPGLGEAEVRASERRTMVSGDFNAAIAKSDGVTGGYGWTQITALALIHQRGRSVLSGAGTRMTS